jgi:hypothetical protein
MPANRPFYEELPLLLLHLAVALFGSALAAILIGWIVSAILSWIRILPPSLPLPYNPLILIPAFFGGFLVNHFARHRSAALIWVVGLLFLVGVMMWDVSILKRGGHYQSLAPGGYWEYELRQLFSTNERACSDSECLGQIFVTTPVILTVAYSIGAWIALRFGNSDSAHKERLDATTHA